MKKTKGSRRVQRLVRILGGPAHLQRRLAGQGVEVTVKGIAQWIRRDRVPAQHLLTLDRLAREDGRAVNLDVFLEPDTALPDAAVTRELDAAAMARANTTPSFLE